MKVCSECECILLSIDNVYGYKNGDISNAHSNVCDGN